MRLSDWRGRSPHKDAMTSKVVAVIAPVLEAFQAEPDPECWAVWGEDPGIRYLLLVPTDAGLLEVHVRVNVPQEGPRASAKLARWNRVQTGELALEMANGHRLVSFQVEGQVLRGSDADADDIVGFALSVFAAMDGRTARVVVAAPRRARKPTARSAPARPAGPPALPQLPAPRGD